MIRFYKPWTIFWESFLLVPALLLLFYLTDVHGGREDVLPLSIRYRVQAFLGSALAMKTHEREVLIPLPHPHTHGLTI